MISFNLQSGDRPAHLRFIAEELKEGKIAILPTSTIYGISCRFDNTGSIKKVYEIKKRPQVLPFIVLLPDISSIFIFADQITPAAEFLIERYWKPIETGKRMEKIIIKSATITEKKMSPLTLVFKTGKIFRGLKNLFNIKDTIALRLDPLEILEPVLRICGPVISTSATISGTRSSPKRIEDISCNIRQKVDVIADIGFDLPGTPSTIIDVTGSTPVLLREGKLKFSEILGVLNIESI